MHIFYTVTNHLETSDEFEPQERPIDSYIWSLTFDR